MRTLSGAARRALAVGCAGALLASGCGGEKASRDGRGTTARGTSPGATAPPAGARTEAADRRATLTGLLADHAALSAFHLNAVLAEGLDGPAAAASGRAVDAVARQLATVVSGREGSARGEAFLGLWRAQTGACVDYAKARAASDATAEAEAEQRLDGLRDELGDLLDAGDVPGELASLTRDVLDAVDAATERSAGFYDQLRRAGVRSAALSRVLAGASNARTEEPPDGSPTAPATELRARVTALLAGHVHLIAAAVGAGAGAGFDSPAYREAADVLDRGSQAVAVALGDALGERVQRRALELRRRQVGLLVAYATAQLDGDRRAARIALEDLDGWRRTFGAFVAEAVPTLPAGAVTQQLGPDIEAMAAAIRATVKRSPRTFERLLDASARAQGTAALLADGVARAQPDRFPSG